MMTSVSLWIHVQPRAGKTEVVGWHGDAVKLRLKAAPVDGAANEELIRFLAKTVGVPRTAVQIACGTTARRKHVKIEGVDKETVMSSLGI
jgi:uncharacterized protein (TIGR00251 family)